MVRCEGFVLVVVAHKEYEWRLRVIGSDCGKCDADSSEVRTYGSAPSSTNLSRASFLPLSIVAVMVAPLPIGLQKP
jgi:hypothetical protein